MPETNQIAFNHKELAEILVKSQNLHEGLWGVYIEFGLVAGNVGDATGTIQPTAIIPVVKIGIQRFAAPNNLTVDAAQVNPANQDTSSPHRARSPLALDRRQ